MSFIHLPIVALGSLAVIAPILLHLIMRRKPVPAVFPAMRFVKARQQTNQTKLRLRHWALLALRCAAIVALAAAIARPVVAAGNMGNWLLAGMAAVAGLTLGGLSISSRSQTGNSGWRVCWDWRPSAC